MYNSGQGSTLVKQMNGTLKIFNFFLDFLLTPNTLVCIMVISAKFNEFIAGDFLITYE